MTTRTNGNARPLVALPKTPHRRVSSDSAWPIRRHDGLTPAQVRPTYRAKVAVQPMPEPRAGFLARLLGRGGNG